MKSGSIISMLRDAVNFNYLVHSCLIIDAFFQAGGDLLGHLTGPWPPPDSQGDAQDFVQGTRFGAARLTCTSGK